VGTALLIAAGLLLLFVLAVAGIGAATPRNHRATVTARFSKPPAELWQWLADVKARAQWRTDLRGVESATSASGNPVFVEISRHGRMPLEVVESNPPKRLVLRIADPKLPFGGAWIHELAADGSGTLLAITEDGEIKNILMRGAARLFFGYHSTLEAVMQQLARCAGDTIVTKRS
jgi:uncharacterized protein YndB with AHSA1/START domain